LFLGTCTILGLRASKLVPQALREAQTFHAMKEAGRYADIYDAASVEMRRAVTNEQFAEYIGKIRQRLGNCQVPLKAANYLANANTARTTVQLSFHVTCAQGTLDEVLTFLSEGNALKLYGYRASSPFALN
jgi:hypothetical protein